MFSYTGLKDCLFRRSSLFLGYDKDKYITEISFLIEIAFAKKKKKKCE